MSIMKKKQLIGLLLGVVILLALAAVLIVVLTHKEDKTSGMNQYEQFLVGKWAYIHDTDTKALVFYQDGSAKFEGESYTFTSDAEFIYLVDSNNATKKLRYRQTGDSAIDFYVQSLYVLEDGTVPQSIEGCWVCPEKKWTFEFTSKGTFLEDGVLTGHYYLDEEKGMLQLAYEKALEDTFMYYSVSNEGLFVEYPWAMVKMK